MRKSFSRIRVLCGRNLKEILRDPLTLILMIALPLAMEILFYLIFHGLTSQFEMKYLAPGIVVFAQSFLSLFVGLLLALDRATSFLTRLFVSEARPFEFISGYAASVLPIVLAQSVLFFLVGGLFDRTIFCAGTLPAILISLVTALFFISAGLLLGSLCNEKSIGGVSSILIAAQSVLSGMWFPVEGLKDGMVKLMNVLPFRNATKLVQNTLTGVTDTWGDFLLPLLIVLGYTIVTFAAAVFVFRKRMRA
jgi:ABC-2 type transport system permease protein